MPIKKDDLKYGDDLSKYPVEDDLGRVVAPIPAAAPVREVDPKITAPNAGGAFSKKISLPSLRRQRSQLYDELRDATARRILAESELAAAKKGIIKTTANAGVLAKNPVLTTMHDAKSFLTDGGRAVAPNGDFGDYPATIAGRRHSRRLFDDEKLNLKGGETFTIRKRRFLHDALIEQDAEPVKPFKKLMGDMKGRDTGLFTTLHHWLTKQVMQSERYVLDEDALRTVMETANTSNIDRLRGMLLLARLPHEQIFLEYDGGLRNHINRQNGTYRGQPQDDPPSQYGYLLKRINPDDPTVWTAQPVLDELHAIDFPVFGLMFDTEKREWPVTAIPDHPLYDSPTRLNGMGMLPWPGEIPERLEEARLMHAIPWGLTSKDESKFGVGEDSELSRGCRVLMPCIATALLKEGENNGEQAANSLVSGVWAGMGDARFLCAFISLLNTVPISNVVRSGIPGKRVIGTRVVRYMSHSVLRINLARTEAVKKVHKAASQETRKRHYVRMHLRTVEWPTDGTPACSPIEHREMERYRADGEGYVRCNVCGCRRKWIDKFERGDASKGWVLHEHVDITSSKTKILGSL